MTDGWHGQGTGRADDLAARRRLTLLVGLLVAALIPPALGAWQTWPLLLVPVVLASLLAGPSASALVAAVVAMALALIAGRPEADDGVLATGFVVACLLSALAGVRHGQLERALQAASARSLTDSLTGLPNYAYLSEALPHEVRRSERYGAPLSVVLLDLDGFKPFNDRWGHEAGNRMLAAVGATLQAAGRASDVVGRFGGEEFTLIVPGDAAEARDAAERIRAAVAQVRIEVAPGAEAAITLSAGVAEHVPGETVEALLRRADAALYAAKDAGRDRVVVDRSADELRTRRRAA
ncbi:MAG TPA: GGDEF domain-containing protein [Miltoncostaeaceae bacterium]|nr:GGDEF domain-containing protein [Miltoncostaeaceae bacterium]